MIENFDKVVNKLSNLTEVQGPVLVIDHATALETMVLINRLHRKIQELEDTKYVSQMKLPFNVGDEVYDILLNRKDVIDFIVIHTDKDKTLIRYKLKNHTGYVDNDGMRKLQDEAEHANSAPAPTKGWTV